jgi:hypothetical protein
MDITRLGSARGSRTGLKAWPLLRMRCSGALAETILSNHRNTEITEGFRQDEQNFQNRGIAISEIEGKVVRVAMSEGGARTSFNRGKGFPR